MVLKCSAKIIKKSSHHDMSFFMKKTKAAPSIVPNKGIKRPIVMPIKCILLVTNECLNIFYSCIKLRLEITVVILAEHHLVGRQAYAFMHRTPDIAFKR